MHVLIYVFHILTDITSNSVTHLVMNELPLASLPLAPIDIDEIAPLPPPSIVMNNNNSMNNCNNMRSSSLLEPASVTTPLSASRLRLLQDTTMIESALDLDSLEEASIGHGSQTGLIKMGVP
ncbi:hypothetical protein TKK_0002034 [Trichogramma kaykai]